MKKIVVTLAGLILIIVQLSITNRFRPIGVSIDFLLIYAVIMAMYLDTKTNYICIVILSIIYDSLISTIPGISLSIMLLITYIVKILIDFLHEEKTWSIALLFFLSSFISVSLYFLANQLFFVAQTWNRFTHVLMMKSILNLVVGILMTLAIRPAFNHIMKNWW